MPIVYSGIQEDEEEKGFLPATGSAVLSALELLERPSQALKVGIKEAADDDDEGFGQGFMRGLTGEEVVRTQDYLPEDFVKQHPILSGIVGFTGDVLTDPLTYAGGILARGAGKGISATAKATPGYNKASGALKNLGERESVQNLARRFNVSYGEAKRVQEFGKRANDMLFSFGTSIDNVVNEYMKYAAKQAKSMDVSKEDIDSAFRSFIERHNYGDNFKSYKTLPVKEGDKLTREFKQISDILGEEGMVLAKSHREMYDKLIKQERELGIRTGQVNQQMLIGEDWVGSREYLPHIATPQTRMKWGDEYLDKDPLQKEGFLKQRGLDVDIDEANQLWQEKYGFNAFHTDPAIMAGVRYSNSAASQSRTWFRNQVKQFGKTKNEMDSIDLPKKGFQQLSDYVEIKDLDGVTSRFYPKPIAKIIKEREEFILGKGKSNEFLRWYDNIQNGWKRWTLGVRPSYHTRNVVGNMLNAYVIAGTKNPLLYLQAGKLQTKVGAGTPLKETGEYMGTGLSEKELWAVMNSNNIVSRHQYGIDVLQRTEDEMERLAGFKKTGMEKLGTLGADNPFVETGFKYGGALEKNARIAVFVDKMRKAKTNPSLRYYDPVTGRKIKISETLDAEGNKDIIGGATHYANQEVKKALFDYSDLSKFERTVLKRFMPFYTWSRKNIPAQLEALVKNPQRLEQLNIARAQFEYMGGRPDEADIGPFWRGRVPIFLGKEKNNVRKAFSLLNYAPIADMERLYEAFGDPKTMLKDMASPLIKVPFEQIANYDTFRESPLVEYKGQSKDFLGVKLPARLYNLAQILVPLADLNRVNPMGVFGKKTRDPVTGEESVTRAFGGLGAARESGAVDVPGTARFIRFFLGVQEYDINLAQNQYWRQKNFVKDIQSLKSKMKWALAKGQNRKAQELIDLIDEVLEGDTRDPLYLGR